MVGLRYLRQGHLRIGGIVSGLFSVISLFAQRIDNESLVRNIEADHYFRFYYENDFVYALDYYYTSGMNLELVKPSLQKNPLNKLFFPVPGSKMRYGLALDHYAFTPTHITSNKVLYGDRPYAGCISINSFRMATDEKRKRKISTSLILGLIGPPALWGPFQYRLHKSLFPAPQPKGWDFQIQTDLILSYKINFEKNLIGTSFFLLNGSAEAVAGTKNDKLSGGLDLMVGKMNNPFAILKTGTKTNWQLYFFARCFMNLIGYDATLQGGLFNRQSPYTLSASAINRSSFQRQMGIVLNHKRFYLELAQNSLSKEFKTGLPHRWGSLGIAFAIK